MAIKYMNVAQAAQAWRISPPRIRQWLADGRIMGAMKIGRDWLIPAKAARPVAAKPGGLGARFTGAPRVPCKECETPLACAGRRRCAFTSRSSARDAS
jgi:hypothetical protein